MILTSPARGGIAVKLPCWVNKCPYCGYVAQKISDKISVTQKWIAVADGKGKNAERAPAHRF